MKKAILLSILLSFGGYGALSTPQVKDQIVVNGDTMELCDEPLGYYFAQQNLTIEKMAKRRVGGSTACYRGYVATWLIENDSLYLTEIWCDEKLLDLSDHFGPKCRDGRVWADWCTDTLYAQYGRHVYESYWHRLGHICERERSWPVRGGVVATAEEKDYSTLTAAGRRGFIRIWNRDSLDTGSVLSQLVKRIRKRFRWTPEMTESKSVKICFYVGDDLSNAVLTETEYDKRNLEMVWRFMRPNIRNCSAEAVARWEKEDRRYRERIDSMERRIAQTDDPYVRELKRVLSSVKVETILWAGRPCPFLLEYQHTYYFDPRHRTIRGVESWHEDE